MLGVKKAGRIKEKEIPFGFFLYPLAPKGLRDII